MKRLSLRAIPVRAILWEIWASIRKIGPRVYAAILICVIFYLTFRAVRYLVVSLATSRPPAAVVDVPLRLDRSVLATERAAWEGLETSEQPRSALAHYHRLDGWVAPDRFSGCTQAGCHAPLPHSKHKEVRAFLNMHATSIHCGVCHMKTDDRPLPLVWYDLQAGKSRSAPAVLEAYDMVMSGDAPSEKDAATAAQDRLAGLLSAAAKEAGNLPVLEQLAEHVRAYRATSDEFAKLWIKAREVLPRHFRGEYGAKLALRDSAGRPILAHPNTQDAVRTYLQRGSGVEKEERDRLLVAVHPLKRDKPRYCTECHTVSDSLLDFSKAGYPRARVEALTNPVVFQMIEHISAGRAMYLPGIASSQPTESQSK